MESNEKRAPLTIVTYSNHNKLASLVLESLTYEKAQERIDEYMKLFDRFFQEMPDIHATFNWTHDSKNFIADAWVYELQKENWEKK